MSYYDRIESTALEYADLSGISFRGANLTNACFHGANLEGADFRGANFKDADLAGAIDPPEDRDEVDRLERELFTVEKREHELDTEIIAKDETIMELERKLEQARSTIDELREALAAAKGDASQDVDTLAKVLKERDRYLRERNAAEEVNARLHEELRTLKGNSDVNS